MVAITIQTEMTRDEDFIFSDLVQHSYFSK